MLNLCFFKSQSLVNYFILLGKDVKSQQKILMNNNILSKYFFSTDDGDP
jgi:hypothetical protein